MSLITDGEDELPAATLYDFENATLFLEAAGMETSTTVASVSGLSSLNMTFPSSRTTSLSSTEASLISKF